MVVSNMKAHTDEHGVLSSSSDQLESDERSRERDLFRERLKVLIPERGVNAFAKRAGISASGLRGSLENGNPGREQLVAIARTAGVSVEWLATGEGPREPIQAGQAGRSAEDARDFVLEERAKVATHPGRKESNPIKYHKDRVDTLRDDSQEDQALLRAVGPVLDRLVTCLEAVQLLPVPINTRRQIMLSFDMINLIDYLSADGNYPDRLDQEDLVALAGILHKYLNDQGGR